MNIIVALIKIILFALMNVVIILTQGPALLLLNKNSRAAYAIPRLWHRGTSAIFGLKVKIEGTPVLDRQIFFVSNHLSYIDIPVVGNFIPYASFVAKEDVEHWPLFGFLAKLQQTAFISRARHKAAAGRYALTTMVEGGKSVILFPEGTTTDGRTALPFKSSLFSIPLEKGLTVQPITIVLESVDGQPLDGTPEDQAIRDRYAWHSEMTMPPHLWGFITGRGAQLKLIFHPPCQASNFENRKALADYCQAQIAAGLDTPPVKQAA